MHWYATWSSILDLLQDQFILFVQTHCSQWLRLSKVLCFSTYQKLSFNFLYRQHLTDLWLYTLEFQDSLSIPEVRETWERERTLLPQAIFLHLPYWDHLGLPLTGTRSSSSWFWNCNSHSFFGSCWLGKNKYFLGKCEKFLFYSLSGRRAIIISLKKYCDSWVFHS